MRKLVLLASVALMGCASPSDRVQTVASRYDQCMAVTAAKPEYDPIKNAAAESYATPAQSALLQAWSADADRCAAQGISDAPSALRPVLAGADSYRQGRTRLLSEGKITWGAWNQWMQSLAISVRQQLATWAINEQRQEQINQANWFAVGYSLNAVGQSLNNLADREAYVRRYNYSNDGPSWSPPLSPPSISPMSPPPTSYIRQPIRCSTIMNTTTCN